MEISLEEAFHGKSADITIDVSGGCDTCDGSGAAPGTEAQTCRTCGGMGKVRAQQGFFVVERACPSCGGAGETIADPCRDCRSEEHTSELQSLMRISYAVFCLKKKNTNRHK